LDNMINIQTKIQISYNKYLVWTLGEHKFYIL
jgi:hypothetical protein